MSRDRAKVSDPLAVAAKHAVGYRDRDRPLHPTADLATLRAAFHGPLPEAGVDPATVIEDLIAFAEPGLVDNTSSGFHGWVMGGSAPVGVAADWLTSIWGQNAALFQTAPAAAVAEEAVEVWLLDLLDLPRESSVGLVTGATMAGFVGLAAARSEVLRRHGHDFEADGLQGAPELRVFLSDDAHVSDVAAAQFLGLGQRNIALIPSNAAGLMQVDALAGALADHDGPKIIVAQAGHINSGGFEDFNAIADLAQAHRAWVHVDGAFGLWARALDEKAHLTDGIDRADSWSVDGHKWVQTPYECGFAIVRDLMAHKRAMTTSAGYLSDDPGDGRNPNDYGPELSRRARGFAAWAVLRAFGREGIKRVIQDNCSAAFQFAQSADRLPGLSVLNDVALNQVALVADDDPTGEMVRSLERRLNDQGRIFVKSAVWKGRTVLRFSFVTPNPTSEGVEIACDELRRAWDAVSRHVPTPVLKGKGPGRSRGPSKNMGPDQFGISPTMPSR